MSNHPQHNSRFDAAGRIAYVNALFIIGTLGTLITPALLESWERLHWRQSQMGLVAGIELATLAAGSLSGLYWQRRWEWRPIASGALVIAAVANAACMSLDDFVWICIARGLVGFAGGLLSAVYSAFLANTRSPGRMIAVMTFIQIGIEAVFLFSVTSIFTRLGSSGLFVLMATLFVILVPLVRVLPCGWPVESLNSTGAACVAARSSRGYPLLMSFLPFVLIQTGVYTFLAEFGRLAAHLSVEATMHAIGISVVFSALGSVAAYVLNDRGGLLLPIGAALVVMAATILALFLVAQSGASFLVTIALLQFAWIFLNCYLYSALICANNLLVPAATPLAAFGSAFGAGAMGYTLDRAGLMGALCLSAGALILTTLLTIPFLASPRITSVSAA